MNYENLLKQLNKVKEKKWDVSREGQVTYNEKLAFVISDGESFVSPKVFDVFILSKNKDNKVSHTFLGKFNEETETKEVFDTLKEITTRLKKESDDRINNQRQNAINELVLE